MNLFSSKRLRYIQLTQQQLIRQFRCAERRPSCSRAELLLSLPRNRKRRRLSRI
jgi:hypothetical protein